MPALVRHPMGILAFCLVALFAMPATARADSDEVKIINGATVRVRVIGGKTYLAVKSGGPLVLKYADGTTMATIPNGTALMVSQIVDSSSGSLVFPNGDFTVALSNNSSVQNLNFRHSNGTSMTVSRGHASIFKTQFIQTTRQRGSGDRVSMWITSTWAESTTISGAERDLLSATN